MKRRSPSRLEGNEGTFLHDRPQGGANALPRCFQFPSAEKVPPGFKDLDLPAEPMNSDSLLVTEWNKLTLQERDEIQEQIHGVADYAEEIEEEIDDCITKLEHELRSIRKRSAYDKAVFLNPKYVKSRDFRLMFLRSEKFDTKKTASKIVAYFEMKLMLFGIEKLGKIITYEDLSTEALECVHSGSGQILPGKDRSGRRIIFCLQKYQKHKAGDIPELQMSYHMIMKLLEDPLVQKRGAVLVMYNVDCGPVMVDPKHIPQSVAFMKCMPIRSNATHYCYNNPSIKPFMDITKYMLGKESRLRFRTHYGSHLECQYALMTFGIVRAMLPVDSGGKVDWTNHKTNIANRKTLENARKEAQGDLIIIPNKLDVLLGRGKQNQEFPGNLRLALIIDIHRQEYQASKWGAKSIVCDKLVRIVRGSGGRFLKRNSEETHWEEVDDTIARDKVSHGFRTKTRRNMNKLELQSIKKEILPSIPASKAITNDEFKRRRIDYETL